MARGQSLYDWCQENGEWGQQLLFEFGDGNGSETFFDEETGMLKGPMDFSRGTNKKIPWTCKDCGRKWKGAISDRVRRKYKCSDCALLNHVSVCKKAKITDKNKLYFWCKDNGEWGQRLIDEWVGIDIDGNTLSMYDVPFGSHTYVKWRCKNGHEWYEMPYYRSKKHYGCTKCLCKGTSYTEQVLFFSLMSIFKDVKNRYKFRGVEYDIAILDNNTFIEYSPSFTHKSRKERDILKAQLCLDNSIRFIYIADNFIYDTLTKQYVEINNYRDYKDIIDKLLRLLGSDKFIINFEDIEKQAYEASHGEVADDKKLINVYPELAKEFHSSNAIDINTISYGQKIKATWMCINCNYIWGDILVNQRASMKSGCPNCGYNWYKAQIGQPQKLKKSYKTFKNDASTPGMQIKPEDF